MKQIHSLHNSIIKQIRALHTKKGRRTAQQCIAQGFRTCQTLYQHGYDLLQLYATESALPEAIQIDQNNVTCITQNILEKISTVQTPSGILGVFKIPEPRPLTQLSTGVILVQITDPGNMGTLIRSAAAFNYKTVICVGGVDPWSPKVIQASAGTIAATHIFKADWNDVKKHKNKLVLSALTVQSGQDITTCRNIPRLLVVGNEAHGIPHEWLNDCDEQITITMPGEIESLNAAVAGSLALYLLRHDKKEIG